MIIKYPYMVMSGIYTMDVSEESGKLRTSHHSFRITEDTFLAIEKEAKDKGTSVNALTDKILTDYCKRDRYFNQLGFVPISKDILRKWLSRIDKKLLIEDSKELGCLASKEYLAYFFQDGNRYTLLEFLNIWFSKLATYQHKTKGATHSFVVKHDINMEFSTWMSAFLTTLIESIISYPVRIHELTPSTLGFEFDI